MAQAGDFHVVWLKRDLRAQDNPALLALAQWCRQHPERCHHARALIIYVHEPSRLARQDCAQQHRNFVLETLQELQAELFAHGAVLWQQTGEVERVLSALNEQTPITHLWATQETTHAQDFERDIRVHRWCASKNIRFHEAEQNGVRRGSKLKQAGFDFRAHLTQNWSRPPADAMLELKGLISWHSPASSSCLDKDVPNAAGSDKPLRQRGGLKAATQCLDEFFELEKVLRYPGAISSPLTAPTGCSRLSAYLAYGVVSDAQVFARIKAAQARFRQQLLDSSRQDLCVDVQGAFKFYLERLYWRACYLQVCEIDASHENQVDLPALRGVREAEHVEQWFDAWKEGRTGFPLVDASMSFLREHGWVNMRMRGLLASFALNDLWLDWRAVRDHLALEFLDYEPAIHHSQIAIHAGGSRLSGPLVYDAVKQARDQDPTGAFVRQWVPALRDVPDDFIFEPWAARTLMACGGEASHAPGYPRVLVPPSAARQAAKERIEAMRQGRQPARSTWWRERQMRIEELRQSRIF